MKGSRVYLVPRADGEIVVGASSEEVGFDLHPRAGAIYELLRDAQSLMPGARRGPASARCQTSLRPAAPDNAPIIGPSTDRTGWCSRSGHYRNGILLTPITADLVADLIATGDRAGLIAPFEADRFTTVPR